MKHNGNKQQKLAAAGLKQSATAPPPARQPMGWRKWAYRLLAVILGPTLVFGALELALWLAGYGYPTRFFIRSTTTDNAGFYVENLEFGKRFFPPSLLRNSEQLRIAAAKPQDCYRVFVLGESAALGYPDPSSGFSRILEVMLRESYPGRRFEVINTAMVAINSHVILPIARDCARHEPDLFVVFMGNNEVVGPFGLSGVIGPYSPSLHLLRTNLLVKTTRTGQLLHQCIQSLGSAKTTPRNWDGMRMFVDSQVPADDARLDRVYHHLQANLEDICNTGTSAGAQVIVCTVPVNLKDSAPFASVHRRELTSEQLETWTGLYQEGVQLEDAGEFGAAIDRYETAADIDRHYADLQFRLGRCCLAQRQLESARKHFRQARDLDALRFRADTRINDTIRTVAATHAQAGVHLLDAERIFADRSPADLAGEEFFSEHVHLNFSGNYLLAHSVFEKVRTIVAAAGDAPLEQAVEALSEEKCAEMLAHSGWNRFNNAARIEKLLASPPFTNQLDHTQRTQRWHRQVEELRVHLKPAALRDSVAVHERALQRAKDDWMIRFNLGQLLAATGDRENAQRQYMAILQHDPHIFAAHLRLGDLLLQARQIDEAIDHYRAALRIHPTLVEAHYSLAWALALNGAVDDARAIYAAQVRTSPNRPEALLKLAGFLLTVGQVKEAKKYLVETLEIDPNEASAHAQLGLVLADQGASEEAVAHLETALRLRPDWPEVQQRLKELQLHQK